MQNSILNPDVLELLRFTQTHQRHTEALVRATGEHFNVFNILGIGHYEVKTHSPLLGELLNPKGCHGQGAVFLRLFLDQFGITDFEAETAKMDLEYHIGLVTENSGGRIDIVIRDGKGAKIFIENKIYAGDQPNQLERYRKEDSQAHLFYLTLKGDNPAGLSKEALEGIKCKCISYASDIRDWLKACLKEAACLPGVREIINQYIHLIEKLTNQSTTIAMNEELINKIVDSKDSLAAFFTLREAEIAVQTKLIARLDTQLDDLSKALGLKRQGQIKRLGQKCDGFYFTTPGLEECNLQIGFEFEMGGYRDFFFGFSRKDIGRDCPIADKIFSAFKAAPFRADKTQNWPAWAWWDEYRNWDRETFEAIRSGQFANELKVKLQKLAEIGRQVCPD